MVIYQGELFLWLIFEKNELVQGKKQQSPMDPIVLLGDVLLVHWVSKPAIVGSFPAF